MIMDNENKKQSRNRKRRIEQRIRMNDDIKLILKKLNLKKKRNIKSLKKLNN